MKLLEKLRSSYSTKLIVTFTLLNLFGMVLSGSVFYVLLCNSVYENYAVTVEDTAAQMRAEIDRKMDEIKRMGDLYIFDQSFHATVRKPYEGLERQNLLNEYLLPKGNAVLVLSDMRLSVKLYLNNETVPEYYYTRAEDSSAPAHRKFEVMHASRITDTPYYQELNARPDYMIWEQVEEDTADGSISLIAKLADFSAAGDSGVLRIVVGLDELFGHSLPEAFQQEVSYRVLNQDGYTVYSHGEMLPEKQDSFQMVKELAKGGFTLELHMPRSNISHGLTTVLRNVSLIVFICFLLTFVMALLFRRILYANINRIVDGVREFQNGNYEARIESTGGDEFSSIATALNGLAQSTEHLVNDVYEVMIQKQDAELQMLQAKINPHFMYNIFSIISQLASAGKDADIIQIVQQTSRFYRRALSKKTAGNNLSDELAILDDYFDIIEVQRPGAVEKYYEIAEAAYESLMPNFILQPIVENAVKHAMVDGHISITVTAQVQGADLCITVADNGIGMTEEQAQNLLTYQPNSGYGLYNISERLRLRYADPKYGISCRSSYGKGTAITLLMPRILREDEEAELDV